MHFSYFEFQFGVNFSFFTYCFKNACKNSCYHRLIYFFFRKFLGRRVYFSLPCRHRIMPLELGRIRDRDESATAAILLSSDDLTT